MIGPIYAAPVQNFEELGAVPYIKPIRILQFTITILLSLMLKLDSPTKKDCAESIFAALCYSIALLLIIDIISQWSGDPIPDTPMFLFGLFAVVLFFWGTINMYSITKQTSGFSWRLPILLILSICSSILFFLDVLLIFLYGY